MTPLMLLIVALIGTLAAIPLAAADQSSAADLVVLNPIGWSLGLLGVLCFMWFRAADLAVAGGPDYSIPLWNPQRVAIASGIASWLASVYHAYVIAEALARQ